MVNNKNLIDAKLRKESSGDSIYYPLPRNILKNIFDSNMADRVLGVLSTSFAKSGSWNQEHGLFVHTKSGTVYALLAQQAGLITLNRYFKNADDAWTINEKHAKNKREAENRFNALSSIIGENIGFCQLYDYDSSDISVIIERHFIDPPGYLFIQDKTDNSAGSISVYSIPTENTRLDLPASHPSMISQTTAEIRSTRSEADILSQAKDLLKASFSDKKEIFVPNVNPTKASEVNLPIDKTIVSSENEIKFLRSGPVRQTPVFTVSPSSVVNTASTLGQGTHEEFTYTGFCTNPGPSKPSSSFFPHPYWVGTLFGVPLSIIKDPKTAAALVALALLSSNARRHKYINNYKEISNVIDNEQTEKALFKEN